MTQVMDKRIEMVGEYMTLNAAAQLKGSTPDAVRLWLRRHAVPLTLLGKSILITVTDLNGYEPTKR